MIGSQKFVPLVSGTTFIEFFHLLSPLWLALKSLYLWYLEQLLNSLVNFVTCCDWLSKVCTFGIWNNISLSFIHCNAVVIGSQKFVPLVSGTTYEGIFVFVLLWLALKSLYLWYLEQRRRYTRYWCPSCDWLSKVCTFGIWNNLWVIDNTTITVVIGSQSLYLWYLEQPTLKN